LKQFIFSAENADGLFINFTMIRMSPTDGLTAPVCFGLRSGLTFPRHSCGLYHEVISRQAAMDEVLSG
jgi:hypothetical protein